MRIWVRSIFSIFLCLCVSSIGFCQEPSAKSSPELLRFGRPQLSVLITEHNTGADLVTVSALSADYPAPLLQQQIQQLGRIIGSDPRGLQVFTMDYGSGGTSAAGGMKILKATFAVDGLYDLQTNSFNLQPIARAFASGGEKFRIKQLSVIFSDQKPSATTLRKYENPAVAVEAIATTAPPAVEFQILLKNSDPNQITIPLEYKPTVIPKSVPTGNSFSVFFFPILLVLGAIAIGALVYSVLVRSSSGQKLR